MESTETTTTIHLPTDVAGQLLCARGWQRLYTGHVDPRPSGWRSPYGEKYWHTDEALTVALTEQAQGV